VRLEKIRKYYLVILLIIHLLINVTIYLNTNTFSEISESGSIFRAYDSLIGGNEIVLFWGYYFYAPAIMAFFINQFLGGGLLYYFLFQIILSTTTVYILYRVILFITNSKKQALISVILVIFYTEYNLLSSIFYNQIYEVFFVSIFLLFVILFNDEKKVSNILIYMFLLLLIIYFSMFFRKALIFIYIIFVFLLLFNIKDKTNLLKFSIITVVSFIILFIFNPYEIYNSRNLGNTETLFWGHTLYGGNGGEAAFMYPKNEEKYKEKLKQYIKVNNIDTLTQDVINNFEFSEIKIFIKNEPHKWILLQIRKFIYTFGSVPQRDGLIMLYKGKINMHWVTSALILQIPYAIILIMFLLCLDLNYKEIISNSYKRIIYSVGVYLIAGICFFGAYQERYRPVIFVCFFIPIISINYLKIKNIFNKNNRKELIIKSAFILILIVIWIFQAYEAIVIYPGRYFKVVE